MSKPDFAEGVDSSLVNEGGIEAGTFEGRDVVVVRRNGSLCALSGVCTHLKGALADGILVDDTLRCPLHHARFDITTGVAVDAPAFEPLQRYAVAEKDGKIRITGELAPGERTAPSNSVSERIVVIGGGAAAHALAEMMARHGAADSLMLFSDDSDAPYDRTACSKAYLAGDSSREDAALPLPGTHVNIRHEAIRAIRIDEREIETAAGERVGYDKLVIATGAEPIVPEFTGSARDDVFTLRTLADADRLIAAFKTGHHAIVLGASYIALEAASSLRKRGLQVTVVAPDEIPLAKTVGPEMGAVVHDLHCEHDVSFHLGREVASWDGNHATLDDGTRIAGDMIIAGTGVRPRVGLAEKAGLEMASDENGGGILVDAYLRTSDPHIHAIGDVASYPDPRLGHRIRVEHWVVAQRMGQWLARTWLGLETDAYDAIPFFWSGQFNLNLRYVGHASDTDDRIIDGEPVAEDVAIVFREDGADQALLTCGRDRQSLQTEAEWEAR